MHWDLSFNTGLLGEHLKITLLPPSVNLSLNYLSWLIPPEKLRIKLRNKKSPEVITSWVITLVSARILRCLGAVGKVVLMAIYCVWVSQESYFNIYTILPGNFRNSFHLLKCFGVHDNVIISPWRIYHSPCKSLLCSYIQAVEQRYQTVGRSHQEDMTTTWYISCVWTIRSSPPPPRPWNVHSAHCFHS